MNRDEVSSPAAAEEFRNRQKRVAEILDLIFGPLGVCKPELWERKAYLMIVGLIYESLATNDAEISTDELVALSKALAEQRRAETQSRAGGEKENEQQSDAPSPTPPEEWGAAVKQVYGTNFQEASL